MNRSLESRRLRYFLKVAELGSLTRAAEELHVAQPALSQQMRALEEEVGVKLLKRGSRGVTLTEAGARLVAEGRDLLASMQAALKRVRESDTGIAGEVAIGTGQTIGALLMVPLIEECARRYPNVRLQVREHMSGLLPELVRAGGVDFAISYNTRSGHGIEALRVLSEDLCLVGQRRLARRHLPEHRGDAIKLADVASLPLFLSRRGHILRDLLERAAAARGIALQPRAEVDSMNIMKELALGGSGFTILSPSNFGRELEQHDIFMARVVQPRLEREVCLVRREGRALNAAAAHVARTAVEILQGMVRAGAWQGTLHVRAADIRKLA